jgi:enoyl-CoA hydratase/carnithine racemase
MDDWKNLSHGLSVSRPLYLVFGDSARRPGEPTCRYPAPMPVRFETPDDHPHVAVVTIDRPERANSLDPAMLRQLAGAWRRIAEDPEIRCAVLVGGGERVFCSGMDMKTTIPVAQRFARGERVSDEEFEGLRSVATALLAGFDLGTPLVCAINGHARAGGFDLMLASEIRYVVPHATFALEEVALGLYPTGNATVLLPHQIGWVHAHDLLLTARPIDAERAAAIGLVNAIVEPDELMATAFDTADAIANNAPLAVTSTRAGVRELLTVDLPRAYERQEEIGRPLRATEDAREAQRAFVEKRKPVFRGH